MSNAKSGFVNLDAISPNRSTRLGPGSLLTTLRVCALTATVAGAVTFGCGTPHATFAVGVPSSAIAGSPFTVTVTAMVGGSRDTVINSSIHFTSSDSAAVLPTDYFSRRLMPVPIRSPTALL